MGERTRAWCYHVPSRLQSRQGWAGIGTCPPTKFSSPPCLMRTRAHTFPMATSAQFPEESSEDGEFERQEDAFRSWVRADGSTPYAPTPGRYHLYVSLACPWAHRALIVRHLKRLDAAIGCTVVDPVRDERGWAFREGAGFSRDPVNGFAFLSEA